VVQANALPGPARLVLADVAGQGVAQRRLERLDAASAILVQIQEIRGQGIAAQVIEQFSEVGGLPEESEHVPAHVRHLGRWRERAVDDLLLGGRAGVAQPLLPREPQPGAGVHEQPMQRALDLLGVDRRIDIDAGAALEQVDRGNGIVVAPVPDMEQALVPGLRDARLDGFELPGRDLLRQRPPAVSVAQEDDEVGPGRDFLAALDLPQTQPQGLLVQRRLLAHPPAQVYGLEAAAVRHGEVPQPREHMALQRIALLLQIAEGGADEETEGLTGTHEGSPLSPGRRSIGRVQLLDHRAELADEVVDRAVEDGPVGATSKCGCSPWRAIRITFFPHPHA
jgi:hypothetical protein